MRQVIARGPKGSNEGTLEWICDFLRFYSDTKFSGRDPINVLVNSTEDALGVLCKLNVLDDRDPYGEYRPLVDGVYKLAMYCNEIVEDEQRQR